MDLRKNDAVNGTIIDLNDDAQGVLKTPSGAIVFIPNSLVGEEVDSQIIFNKSSYSIGKVKNIKNFSSDRTVPPCPYFLSCGGCDMQHIAYNAQLDFKTQKVQRALKKIAHIDTSVKSCISKNTCRYRNKISLPISTKGDVGLYRKNTHNILKIDDCYITEEWNKILIEIISKYIKQSKISIYNEETKLGLLKSVVARHINNSLLVTMVINGESLPNEKLLIKNLQSAFENFGLNININKLHNNVILSNKWKHLYGLEELIANEYGITYPVSNASFYQVNNDIKTEIYDHVLALIDPNSVVVDAYSGAGLLSAIISKKAKKCYGVEIIPEATDNANKLKEQNNLSNLENINGDCALVIPNLVKSLPNENVIITLDPPRKGCDKKVLEAIIKSQPDKIIYISCNPQTLARDTQIILDSNKYQIDFVQPYDMFPQTSHVETLISYSKL